MTAVDRGASPPVWAVTSYFNPMGYRARRENYRVFRRHLELPLLTVEWSPTGEFELGPGDAEILIQLAGGDVMWQKERLLNIGVSKLPAQCTHVAWLDCDIVFERSGLADAIVEALERDRLVQLYDRAGYLGPMTPGQSVHPGEAARESGGLLFERSGEVAARAHVEYSPGRVASEALEDFIRMPSVGFAWAARRSLLERHPLFDVWILGGGDTAYFFAATGIPEAVVENHRLARAHRDHYLQRAHLLAATVDGRVGHVPGRILSLWHGKVENRRYRSRHAILGDHRFDPARSLRRAASGVWQWDMPEKGLPEAVLEYFRLRAEDESCESESARPPRNAQAVGAAGNPALT